MNQPIRNQLYLIPTKLIKYCQCLHVILLIPSIIILLILPLFLITYIGIIFTLLQYRNTYDIITGCKYETNCDITSFDTLTCSYHDNYSFYYGCSVIALIYIIIITIICRITYFTIVYFNNMYKAYRGSYILNYY